MRLATPAILLGGAAALAAALPARRHAPAAVSANLSEWSISLSEATVPAGPITFTATNHGTIPHAFEVEGKGTEKETALIQPGASATLTLTLAPGTYEVYCPVGQDSHKKLGMEAHLRVVGGDNSSSAVAPAQGGASDQDTDRHEDA